MTTPNHATPRIPTDAEGMPLLIALDKIQPSKTNPRKYIDPAYITELAASIKTTNGVIQPIVLRPMNGSGRYELVAGECRWRASREAGLKDIHAVVRTLDDLAARELQIIENLQRRDVHPMDEGNGYKALLDLREGKSGDPGSYKPIYTIESLAARLGKSVSYIYQRMKLADLTEAAQKAFLKGDLTAGHAILIARLTPAAQKQCLDWMKPDYDGSIPSVKNLERQIAEELHRRLDAAPWKKDDATLDPKIGACSACRFNSAVNPLLTHDIGDKKSGPTCGDGACYDARMEIHLQRTAAELKAKTPNLVVVTRSWDLTQDARKQDPHVVPAKNYEEVKKNAKGAVPALVKEGRDRGSVIYVKSKAAATAERRTERPASERLKELEAAIARDTRIAALCDLAKAAKWDDVLMRVVAGFVVDQGLDRNARKRLLGDRGWDKAPYGLAGTLSVIDATAKANPKGPNAYLVAILGGVLGTEALHGPHHDGDRLLDLAKHFKVDLKATEKTVRGRYADKLKALQTSAKPAATKGKAKARKK